MGRMIAVGGTFNHLHDGHKALLSQAVGLSKRFGEFMVIGVMSDDYLKRKYPDAPSGFLTSWEERCRSIREYVKRDVGFLCIDDPEFVPNNDGFTILVVSEETAPHASKLIAEKAPYILLSVVPMVRRPDGSEIHSRDFVNSYI